MVLSVGGAVYRWIVVLSIDEAVAVAAPVLSVLREMGSYKHRKGLKRTEKNPKKDRKDTDKDRKDTEKDRKDTERDHNDIEKDACTN